MRILWFSLIFKTLIVNTRASLAPDSDIPDDNFTATASTPILSQDLREQLESELLDNCGQKCVDFMNQEVLPLIPNITVPKNTTTPTEDIQEQMKSQFAKFNSFFQQFITNGQAKNIKLLNELSQIQKVTSSFATADDNIPVPQASGKLGILTNATNNTIPLSPAAAAALARLPPKQPGLPCRTQAECDSIDFALNRCSYVRKGALDAYVGSNVAISTMANLITAMCGCVFTGPVHVCVLAPIPYVCGFPFEAYQGLFGLSTALWSAVKLTGTFCSSIGADPIR